MAYDAAEAHAQLAGLHEALSPAKSYPQRLQAAKDLLDAIGAEAKAVGLSAVRHPDAIEVGIAGCTAFAALRDVEVQIEVGTQSLQPMPTNRTAPIVFDPTSGLFVGTTEETYRHPVPGSVRTPRSAVAVVVEMMIDTIRTVAIAKGRLKP